MRKIFALPICLLAVVFVLLVSPALAQTQPPATPEKKAASAPAAKPLTPQLITIKGILVDKSGTPLKDKTVVAYPLNAGGKPLAVSVLDKQGVVQSWNPKTTSGPEGQFSIAVPRITAIGDSPILEFALSLQEPSGGIVTVTVWKIEYAGPEKQSEMALVRPADRISQLRLAGQPLRIKLDQPNSSADLGKIVAD